MFLCSTSGFLIWTISRWPSSFRGFCSEDECWPRWVDSWCRIIHRSHTSFLINRATRVDAVHPYPPWMGSFNHIFRRQFIYLSWCLRFITLSRPPKRFIKTWFRLLVLNSSSSLLYISLGCDTDFRSNRSSSRSPDRLQNARSRSPSTRTSSSPLDLSFEYYIGFRTYRSLDRSSDRFLPLSSSSSSSSSSRDHTVDIDPQWHNMDCCM